MSDLVRWLSNGGTLRKRDAVSRRGDQQPFDCLSDSDTWESVHELFGFEEGYRRLAVHAILVRIVGHSQIVHGLVGRESDAALGGAQPLAGTFWGRWTVICTADLHEE